MADDKKTNLEQAQDLFDFLQGKMPEGYNVKHPPQLSAEQAFSVIWFIGEEGLHISDSIERCGVCGDLFDTDLEGIYREDVPPYFFCLDCQETTNE